MYTLTPAQLDAYHADGYLLVRAPDHGLFSDPHVLQHWSEEVRTWPIEQSVGKWMPYFEDTPVGKQIMRTEKFVDYHDGFRGILEGLNLRGIMKQLGGQVGVYDQASSSRQRFLADAQPMQLFKDKINYKMPNGGGFAPHLDAPAYDHISKVEHITANIAIHPATPENGCLQVVPQSHRMKVDFSHGGHIAAEWCDSHTWVPVPLAVGDILFFGSHLAHRSFANLSPFPRAMLYATYAAESDGPELREQYYSHRRVAFPPDYGGWRLYPPRLMRLSDRARTRSRLFCWLADVCICGALFTYRH